MSKSAWYEGWQEKCAQATSYMNSPDLKTPPDALKAELTTFRNFTVYKAVFESNRIEKAGLSESDTRKLIVDEGYSLDQSPSAIDSIFLSRKLRATQSELSKTRKKQPIVIFRNKKREAREVILHKLAIDYARYLCPALKIKALIGELDAAPRAKLLPGLVPVLNKLSRILSQEENLFSEKTIRDLHFLMANGLIRQDAGVPAGFYRQDPVKTDDQTYYMSYENVPRAMKQFVREANRLLQSEENPIMKAARISYDFVAIHPFPDFNGRLSRLMMNMVLWYEGLPFLAVLRGNAKEKHRYIYSLRRANRGDLSWYAALIAKAVIEGFDQLNSSLEQAGLKKIKPAEKGHRNPAKENT